MCPTTIETKLLMSKQRKGVKQIDRFIKAYGLEEGKKRYLLYINNQKNSRKGKHHIILNRKKETKPRKPISEESRIKHAKSLLGRICPNEVREKIKKSNIGKKRSLETRIKMSNARKGKIFNKEKRIFENPN